MEIGTGIKIFVYALFGSATVYFVIAGLANMYSTFFIMDDLFGRPEIKPFGDELHITDSIQQECNCHIITGKVYIIK
jgi:hypothetical protein